MAKQNLAMPNDNILHQLWTRAVGTDGYSKKDWRQLQAQLEGERKRTLILLCAWLESDKADAFPIVHANARALVADLIREQLLDGEAV